MLGPVRRLRKFYIFKYTNVQQYLNLGLILDNVSLDMRRVVADAMYGDILRGCEVFSNASASLIAAIAVSMRVEVGRRPNLHHYTTRIFPK